jgi:hypothetical protein
MPEEKLPFLMTWEKINFECKIWDIDGPVIVKWIKYHKNHPILYLKCLQKSLSHGMQRSQYGHIISMP